MNLRKGCGHDRAETECQYPEKIAKFAHDEEFTRKVYFQSLTIWIHSIAKWVVFLKPNINVLQCNFTGRDSQNITYLLKT